jgi:hypothetical protein
MRSPNSVSVSPTLLLLRSSSVNTFLRQRMHTQEYKSCKIWDFRGGDYEECSRQGCGAV